MAAERKLVLLIWVLFSLLMSSQVISAEDSSIADTSGLDTWECSFEDDLCDMARHDGANARWIRDNALPPISNQDDNYYITLSGHGTAGLETPKFAASSTSRCLSFYYYFPSADAGSLDIIPKYGQIQEDPVWTTDDAEANIRWMLTNVDINATVDVSVIFEGQTGSNPNESIAVDEIRFEDGPCDGYLFDGAVPELWMCTFQGDFCGLEPVPGDTADWKRNNTLDRIPGALDNWYITVSGSGMAGLETTTYYSTSLTPLCLTFYYYMNGVDGGELNILPRLNGRLWGAIWTQGRPQGDEWILAHAEVRFTDPVSLVIEGNAGEKDDAIIAMDELVMYIATCDVVQPTDTPGEMFTCDFEDSTLCGFKVDKGSGVWVWISPNEVHTNFSWPKYDHTYYTGYGHYMGVKMTSDHEGIVSTLKSPDFDMNPEKLQCVSFWYIHDGVTTDDILSVYITHGFDIFPRPVWRENINHGSMWMDASISIPQGDEKFHIDWRAEQKEKETDGVLALDDMKLVVEPCPKIGTCDFQYGTCGWQNLYDTDNITDDTDWLQGCSRDGLDDDAPSSDHTGSETGKFLYVDGSLGNGTAILESQLLTPEQHNDFCFAFWYYLEGGLDGISISSVLSDGTEKILWEESEETQGNWIQGQVRVEAKDFIIESVPYQLYIRGIKTENTSKIAMDDFNFTIHNSECPKLPLPSTPTTTPVTDIWDCPIDSDDTCGMKVSSHWMIMVDVFPTQSGIGKYALVLVAEDNVTGTVELPVLNGTGTHCMTFWYFMKGGDVGDLTVIVTKDDEREPLWTRGRPGGPVWLLGDVNVPVDSESQISFVALQGINTLSQLCLDEIAVLSTDCHVIQPTVDPGHATCDFEESHICGFTTVPFIGDWDWIYPLEDNMSLPHVPVDHTYQTGYGHYMEAPLIPLDHDGTVGQLVTPAIERVKNSSQCVTFWYVHNGNSLSDTLSVYVNSSGYYGFRLWWEEISYVDTWLDASIPIRNGINDVFHVMWEAKQNARKDHGSMAVDDVLVTVDACPSIGDCDFHTSMCGWRNVIGTGNRTDDTDFIRGCFDDDNSMCAPNTDHTGSTTGMMMFVDTSMDQPGQALLESQLFIPEQHSNLCFHFWYYLQGTSNDSLRVEVEPQDYTIHQIWRQTGRNSEDWFEGQVHVDAKSLFIEIPYQIYIGGYKWSEKCRIAVDDFNFTRSDADDCPTMPPAPVLTTTTANPNKIW